jgi:hypothetical protein
MIWVTWRQHRGEALTALALTALFAALILLTGVQMHDAFDAQGVASCLGNTAAPSCSGVAEAYQQQFSTYLALYQWLNLVPLALGLFIGAPLVAREIERNTHLLAWTQGVTRTRWIVTNVLLLLAATVTLGIIFTLLMGWWLQPMIAIDGSALRPSEFDLQGIAPLGYFVAALAIGTLAGTLIRRTLPAMAVAIIGFLALRFGTIDLLRPHFMAPVVGSSPVGATSPVSRGDWVLNDGLVGASGQSFNGRFAIDQLCGGLNSTKQAINACLQGHGVVETVSYQPAGRYWTFQGIELAEFALIAVLLMLMTVWWVRRRIS